MRVEVGFYGNIMSFYTVDIWAWWVIFIHIVGYKFVNVYGFLLGTVNEKFGLL